MPAFFATITPAGYESHPNLCVVVPLEGFSPGSPPPRPHPEPPLGIWGPTDPRPTHPIAGLPGFPGYLPPYPSQGPGFPTHPIVLPDPLPPTLPPGLPAPGEPGSPSNPYPPGEVPPHAAQGIQKFHIAVQGVGIVGPYYMGPGGVYPSGATAPPAKK